MSIATFLKDNNISIIADDMCISEGASLAIIDLANSGKISGLSVMVNLPLFKNHLSWLERQQSDIDIGVHLNIFYGPSVSKNKSISNKGHLNNTFISIFLKGAFSKAFRNSIAEEFEGQIKKALSAGLKLSHLDSHRHSHMIPFIYPIVKRLSDKYEIPSVRFVDESLFTSLKLFGMQNVILNGGIIKYIIIKFFSIYNRNFLGKKNKRNCHSIMFTGKALKSNFWKIKGISNIEIAVHPSKPGLDKEFNFFSKSEKKYRLHKDRLKEFQILDQGN